jgi:hypothetical protein
MEISSSRRAFGRRLEDVSRSAQPHSCPRRSVAETKGRGTELSVSAACPFTSSLWCSPPFVMLGTAGTIAVMDPEPVQLGGPVRKCARRPCHRRARRSPRPATGRMGARTWRALGVRARPFQDWRKPARSRSAGRLPFESIRDDFGRRFDARLYSSAPLARVVIPYSVRREPADSQSTRAAAISTACENRRSPPPPSSVTGGSPSCAPAHGLGTVAATDRTAAEAEAVRAFGLSEDQRKRLLIVERT